MDGAFGNNILPKIICDAIEVIKTLEYHHLWVESICIVQDDESKKSRIINNLDSSYSLEDLTNIAAAGNSATAGLSGRHIHVRL
jgi:hypothetical protein